MGAGWAAAEELGPGGRPRAELPSGVHSPLAMLAHLETELPGVHGSRASQSQTHRGVKEAEPRSLTPEGGQAWGSQLLPRPGAGPAGGTRTPGQDGSEVGIRSWGPVGQLAAGVQ